MGDGQGEWRQTSGPIALHELLSQALLASLASRSEYIIDLVRDLLVLVFGGGSSSRRRRKLCRLSVHLSHLCFPIFPFPLMQR